MAGEKLSAYLKVDDFKCRHCGKLPDYTIILPNAKTIDLKSLNDARILLFGLFDVIYRRGLVVNSGFRCIEHNEKVGGTQYSPHIFGLALDVEVLKGNRKDIEANIELVRKLLELQKENFFFRVIHKAYKDQWVHIDVMPYVADRLKDKMPRNVYEAFKNVKEL